ncbi:MULTISPECIES: MaoC/PaaZ C-terminal domain-containing protein [Paraburkholderia]|uniref:Dehydratase n=1 Tax=Paraburkholderia podalyriae TaxID=1938811 RepID=A0ABR7PZH2_9BURK|nr:MaoC/PaaZ C-terminal domain-containing protein [Paraburkholderia podalyriae]MBC8751691.1 dehydratase [Paraburkholderia podalyriae]
MSAAIGQNAKFYDELDVGTEWESPRRTITEADIVMFAAITGDHNPVHTDEEFAKNTVFGGRILHGPAAFAIATGLESRLGIKEGTAVAFLGMTWDMRGPVKIGDTIHVYEKVTGKRETKKPSVGIVNFYVAIRNQRNEVVQEGEWKVMMHRRQEEAAA